MYVPSICSKFDVAGFGDFGQTFKVLFFPVLDLSSGEFITVR